MSECSRSRTPRPDFHARYSASGKTYQYRIWQGDVQPPLRADLELARAARRSTWRPWTPRRASWRDGTTSRRSSRPAATSPRRSGRWRAPACAARRRTSGFAGGAGGRLVIAARRGGRVPAAHGARDRRHARRDRRRPPRRRLDGRAAGRRATAPRAAPPRPPTVWCSSAWPTPALPSRTESAARLAAPLADLATRSCPGAEVAPASRSLYHEPSRSPGLPHGA